MSYPQFGYPYSSAPQVRLLPPSAPLSPAHYRSLPLGARSCSDPSLTRGERETLGFTGSALLPVPARPLNLHLALKLGLGALG